MFDLLFAVSGERLGGVEQFVSDLPGGADHDRPVAAGAGLERGGTDDEATPAGSLGTQVLVVIGVDGARLGWIGARVEVGGEGHLELVRMSGAFACGAVGIHERP